MGRGALPSKVASGLPAAIANASHSAASSAESAMRTTPVTPISRNRRASSRATSAGATRAPFTISAASASTLAIGRPPPE
jgi:hypothetical protein